MLLYLDVKQNRNWQHNKHNYSSITILDNFYMNDYLDSFDAKEK